MKKRTSFTRRNTNQKNLQGVEWNLVVVQFSLIMVMLGLPSMYFACFPDNHDELGPGIFAISLITIVILIGLIYHTLTINAERSLVLIDSIVSLIEVYLIIATLQSVLNITEVSTSYVLCLFLIWICASVCVYVGFQYSRHKYQS